MLLSIGPFVFDLAVNAEGYDEDFSEDFARKGVVGARQPFEHSGPGDDRTTIRGNLFPDHLGGAGAVPSLKSLMRQAAPQLMLRGDGTILGWVLITNVRARNAHLDGAGRPGHIEIEVECQACDQPSAAAAFGSLLSLFG